MGEIRRAAASARSEIEVEAEDHFLSPLLSPSETVSTPERREVLEHDTVSLDKIIIQPGYLCRQLWQDLRPSLKQCVTVCDGET